MQPGKAIKNLQPYIGTSNIVLPVNKSLFPEQFRNSSRLAYYGSLFSSLEVNSSFTTIPRPSTLLQWTHEVPAGFRFTIKMNREITHNTELLYDAAILQHFMTTIASVGSHKGCLLLQFPPKITVTYRKKIEQILASVTKTDAGGQWKKCIEFRDSGWYQNAVYKMLDKWETSLVLHDMPGSANRQVRTAAPFVCIRFHGLLGNYRGTYPIEMLEQYAWRIRGWMQEGREVYVYFNNTMGDAFANAQTIQSLLLQPGHQ